MRKIVAIGDSITRGTYTGDGESSPLSVAKPNFAQLVKDTLGYDELINYGVNGVCISATTKQESERAIARRVKEFEKADIALVACGTNDYGTNVALGEQTDNIDISFYGALDIVYKSLKDKYKKVYIITPIPRLDDGPNVKGYTLDDYRKAIEIKAKEYGFFVIDGYEIPINPKIESDRKQYMQDGLHPNTVGHKLYAEYVIKQIKVYESEQV